jgi:archaellum component FlaC
METIILAYSLGIVTVAVFVAAVVNVRLAKKVKELTIKSNQYTNALDSASDNMRKSISDSISSLELEINRSEEHFNKEIEGISRSLGGIESHIMDELRSLSEDLNKRIDETHHIMEHTVRSIRNEMDASSREVASELENLHRKIDSRVDKLESRIKTNQ